MIVTEREGFAAAKKMIAAAGRVLVSGHLSPDGDSLGSMIALARLIRASGVEADAAADNLPNGIQVRLFADFIHSGSAGLHQPAHHNQAIHRQAGRSSKQQSQYIAESIRL